jgi:hypothetical protein
VCCPCKAWRSPFYDLERRKTGNRAWVISTIARSGLIVEVNWILNKDCPGPSGHPTVLCIIESKARVSEETVL